MRIPKDKKEPIKKQEYPAFYFIHTSILDLKISIHELKFLPIHDFLKINT